MEPSYGQPGVVTGPKGCKIPTKSFTIINVMPNEATDCKISWENAANCPDQLCTTDGKIAPNAQAKVTYIAEPKELACGKIASLTVNRASTPVATCKALSDVAPGLLYIKNELGDATKCEVSTTAARGGGRAF